MKNYKQSVLSELHKQIEQGKTVWQIPFYPAELQKTIPYNPVSGTCYTKTAEILLRNKAIEKDYTDPRWITAEQAYRKDWKLKREAEQSAVTIGFVHTDRATGRTVYKYHKLYNAQVVEGIPALVKSRVQDRNKVQNIPAVVQNKIKSFCKAPAGNFSNVIAKYMLAAETGLEYNVTGNIPTDQVKDFFKCMQQANTIVEGIYNATHRERKSVSAGMGY